MKNIHSICFFCICSISFVKFSFEEMKIIVYQFYRKWCWGSYEDEDYYDLDGWFHILDRVYNIVIG